MQALHVVALVERVDHGLPVRVDDRAQRRPQAHLLEVVRAEQLGQRIEVVEQRLRVGVEVDEHEPAPRVDPHRCEREVVGQAHELLAIGHVDEPAVEPVAPAVKRAPDRSLGERAAAFRESSPPMQARVVERVQHAGFGADDRDGLVADRVLEEVARAGNLLLTARDLPDARPQSLLLELGEGAGGVSLLGHEAVRAHEQGVEVGHVRIGL